MIFRKFERETIKLVTQEHLMGFGSMGLRTLLIAKRSIDIDEYNEWAINYHEASTSIQDRENNVIVELKLHKL